MPRFDEIELEPVVSPEDPLVPESSAGHPASLFRRLMALLTDLSLFAALAIALSPLLPADSSWWPIAALAAFVVLLSYYYFIGCWLLWGKTIGGAIFDVRIVPADGSAMGFAGASRRCAGVYLSLLTGCIGFLMAVLPGRLSLPDRMSNTRCVLSA